MKKTKSFTIMVLLVLVCSTSSMALVVSGVNPAGYTVQYNSLSVGATIYIDRSYTFASIPASVTGATYIQTANTDKTSDPFTMSFDIDVDSTVYIAHVDAITPPSWLSVFTDTGENLSGSNPGAYSLYAKDFAAGTITLGKCGSVGGEGSMYIVIIVPISTVPGAAGNPSPTDSATGVSVSTGLSWTAGAGATSHDVYFGTSNPPASIGNQSGTSYDPGTLANGTTYYWRIDEVNSAGTTTGTVWSFTTETSGTAPDPATNPFPADTATDVSVNAGLSWTAGAGALLHDIYFGTSNPPAFIVNQSGTAYDPGTLAINTTYYWQIDEVNAYGTTTGTVWSFTTTPVIYDEIAYWPMDDNAADAMVVDVAGGNNGTLGSGTTSDHHSADSQEGTGSLSFNGTSNYIAIGSNSVLENGNAATSELSVSAWVKTTDNTTQYGTIIGTGDAGWVLARNNNGLIAGFWLSTGLMILENNAVTINDGQWHQVMLAYDSFTPELSLYVDGNLASTSLDYNGQAVSPGGSIQSLGYAVNIGKNPFTEATSSDPRFWNGLIDDVKVYDYAVSSETLYHEQNSDYSWNPWPASGAVNIAADSSLSWLGGDSALSHDVYFGTSESEVINAQRLAGDVNGDGSVDIDDLAILAGQWLTSPGAVNPSADVAYNQYVDLDDFSVIAQTWGQTSASVYKGNQTGTTFNPGALLDGVTYYWRIDEVNASNPESPWIGRVWSFTTLPTTDSGALVFPGTAWETRTPAELGLDGAKLDHFAANVGGVGCIVRQGYMVKTWGDQTSKDDWASASKPVTSTLLFYAIEEGMLSDVHELIGDHGWSMSTKDQTMEFYHLANMTSGYTRAEVPGAAWAYNDYAINLYVKTLFDNVYGTTANTAATNANRLGALGFEDGSIYSSRDGYGVSTTPRDFARIGWLWCNKGYWDGQQLLPQHYFDDYMQAHVPSGLPRTSGEDPAGDYLGVGTHGGGSDQTPYGPGLYGFNWWFNPNQSHWPDAPADTFQANGHWGKEVVTVIPSLSLVVAWRMSTYPDSSYFQPGSTSSPMNQNLKLLTDACPPVQTVPTGSIVVDSDHPAWMKYHNVGPFFMCGPGDPEGFLYRGTRNADGTRTGDQMTLINKLAPTGANCIYLMAIRSNSGDGDSTQNPFVNSNVNGLLDEDILNQWETWFTAMDDNGIVIYFFLYDDSAQPYGRDLVGGELPTQEAYFVDEIVKRFKHHKNLIWCIAEEYYEALSTAHASKIAERIKMMDNFNHPVACHQNPSLSFNFNGDDNMDQFAIQIDATWDYTPSGLHQNCLTAWNNVGGLKSINMSEINVASAPPTGANLRQSAWAMAMAGAYSMFIEMDIASTSVSDLETCGRLVGFMESTRFNVTVPNDSLARGETDYVLADPGHVYIAYGVSVTSSLGVNIQTGQYHIKWFDPIDGDWSDQGLQVVTTGDQYFSKPANIGSEAVIYLEVEVQAGDIQPNDDCYTDSNGVNWDNDTAGGEWGLRVKYTGEYSWIEFTLGDIPVNQATFVLQQDDAGVQNPWTIVVRGAKFEFDETTFTGVGVDYQSWTRIGEIPNVQALGPVTLNVTDFYNAHLGQTVTFHLYRDEAPPNTNGPLFQDKELTRQYWWSSNEGPKISIQ